MQRVHGSDGVVAAGRGADGEGHDGVVEAVSHVRRAPLPTPARTPPPPPHKNPSRRINRDGRLWGTRSAACGAEGGGSGLGTGERCVHAERSGGAWRRECGELLGQRGRVQRAEDRRRRRIIK
jgi:hypothetical protein